MHKTGQRRFFIRLVSTLIILPFVLSARPAPAFSANDPVPSSEERPPQEPESFVQVFSGHSWAKSWGPKDLGEERTEEAVPSAELGEEPAREAGLLRPLAAGEEKNPVAAGIEEKLKVKSRRRGLVHGLMLALLGFGGYELISRMNEAGGPPQGILKVVQVDPKLGPPAPKIEPAPEIKVEAPELKKEEPAPKKVIEPPVAEKKAPASFFDTMDPAMKKRVRIWDAKTGEFFKGQKMPAPITTSGGYRVQAYFSNKSDPDHPDNKYLRGRFWSYDMGVTLVYLAERGELDEARWLGDQMMDLAKQMEDGGQKGGWRFSYGSGFTDARAMTGAGAWVVHGLFDVGLKTKDKAYVARASRLLETVIFPLQVQDPRSPLDGLFLAGYGTGNEYDNAKSNQLRQEVTTEHVWDTISLLRSARRAIGEVDPGSPLLKEIDRRHDLAMRKSREKLLLTPERIRAQMDFLQKGGRLTAEARAQHEKALKEIEGLPGRMRWATGLNPDGTVNISWAFDNEVWSPHGAYDPEMSYNELRNAEARFLLRLRAGQFSNLPKGMDRDRIFVGLKFFTGDFGDAHVKPNPNFERMIQQEATWSYVFRLIQHGHYTTDAKQREWAYNMAREVIDSQLALSEGHGGSPYSTLDIEGYFNTLLAIASNGHQGITLSSILRGGAPADSHLNALPHPDMKVGGKGPAWSTRRGAAPKKEDEVLLPGAVQMGDAFLSVTLPPVFARQLAGKWAVVERRGRSGIFLPVDEAEIAADGSVQFHSPYDPGSDALTGWTGPARKRILVFDNAESYSTRPVSLSQGGEGNALLVLEVGESDFEGRAPVTLRLGAGVEEVRRSYWTGFLAGVAAVAVGWGVFRGVMPKQEPGPVLPKEQQEWVDQWEWELPVAPPAQKEGAVEPPATKKEKEVEPPKTVLEKASVTASHLKVLLPPGLWVRAYLKTDQWYAQNNIYQVPPSGQVVFRVPVVAPPNWPGWLKAYGIAVAAFPTEGAAATAPGNATYLAGITGTSAVITYTPQGAPKLFSGSIPSVAPGKKEESRIRFLEELDHVALALARRSGAWQDNPLLGLGPSALKEHGPELVPLFDTLKARAPAMNSLLVLVGPQAALYAEHPSVLITAAGAEQAAAALSLAGAGTLQYATSDPTEGRHLELALQFRGAAVQVRMVPADTLEQILGILLANLAGMEQGTPQSRVEEFYGVSMGRLAETLELLAQQGV